MYIGGDFTITVDGDSKELVHGNKIVEVDGEYLITVRKDYTKKVEGNELKEIGWWNEIIGQNKAIDINKYYVVCCNNLGGCSSLLLFD